MARVSLSSWARYLKNKTEFSVALGVKNYEGGFVKQNELLDFILKHIFHGKLTFLHCNKGEEMAPTIAGKETTLLVRKLVADPQRCCGLEKNPEEPDNYLVRRLAATEGYEMASADEKDESFVLEEDQCWVVAENEKLKAKEAIDSRTFGPVHMSNIKGRVIYCLRSAVDHGRVQNSDFSMEDSSVLDVELDVDEMAKSHKAQF